MHKQQSRSGPAAPADIASDAVPDDLVPPPARTALLDNPRVLGWGSIVLALAVWETAALLSGINSLYLPRPSQILRALVEMFRSGDLLTDLLMTLYRIFAGFFIALVVGTLLGVWIATSRRVRSIADMWIAALYPLPKITLIPLLIIWLGTGEAYILTISAITAFFPVLISTYAGIRQADQGLVRAARDLGANERQVQMKVIIPAAIPSIFAGLQLGMGVTIILVVAAEMIGGSNQSGMGYLLIRFGQVMETEKVFAALIVLAVFGGVIIKTQERIDRWIAPWAARK